MSKFLSRKFLMAVGLAVFAVLGLLTGQMTWDQASGVVQAAVIAFLAAEGLGDAAGRLSSGVSGFDPNTSSKAATPDSASGISGL